MKLYLQVTCVNMLKVLMNRRQQTAVLKPWLLSWKSDMTLLLKMNQDKEDADKLIIY